MGIAIAIDGPAGAGKSTVSQKVAEKLSYIYIDTGAMYRAVTWQVLQDGTPQDDVAAIEQTANAIDIVFERNGSHQKVYVNGAEVTDEIRSREVTGNVSYVSSLAGVRHRMVELQRQMAKNGGVVMDGRDIGTTVLPNAELKIFLTASIEERARRRYSEMANNGFTGTIEDLQNDIRIRDEKDSTRKISPLLQAEDAVLLETTGMGFQEVVDAIVSLAHCKTSGDA